MSRKQLISRSDQKDKVNTLRSLEGLLLLVIWKVYDVKDRYKSILVRNNHCYSPNPVCTDSSCHGGVFLLMLIKYNAGLLYNVQSSSCTWSVHPVSQMVRPPKVPSCGNCTAYSFSWTEHTTDAGHSFQVFLCRRIPSSGVCCRTVWLKRTPFLRWLSLKQTSLKAG